MGMDINASLTRVDDNMVLFHGMVQPVILMSPPLMYAFNDLCRKEAGMPDKLVLMKWQPCLSGSDGLRFTGVRLASPNVNSLAMITTGEIRERISHREMLDDSGGRVVLAEGMRSDETSVTMPSFVRLVFKHGLPSDWKSLTREWSTLAGVDVPKTKQKAAPSNSRVEISQADASVFEQRNSEGIRPDISVKSSSASVSIANTRGFPSCVAAAKLSTENIIKVKQTQRTECDPTCHTTTTVEQTATNESVVGEYKKPRAKRARKSKDATSFEDIHSITRVRGVRNTRADKELDTAELSRNVYREPNVMRVSGTVKRGGPADMEADTSDLIKGADNVDPNFSTPNLFNRIQAKKPSGGRPNVPMKRGRKPKQAVPIEDMHDVVETEAKAGKARSNVSRVRQRIKITTTLEKSANSTVSRTIPGAPSVAQHVYEQSPGASNMQSRKRKSTAGDRHRTKSAEITLEVHAAKAKRSKSTKTQCVGSTTIIPPKEVDAAKDPLSVGSTLNKNLPRVVLRRLDLNSSFVKKLMTPTSSMNYPEKTARGKKLSETLLGQSVPKPQKGRAKKVDDTTTGEVKKTTKPQKKNEPKEKKGESKAKKSEPKERKSEPKERKNVPKERKSELKERKSEPKERKSEPKERKSEPKERKSEPKERKSELKERKSELKERKSEPKERKGESKESKKQPKDINKASKEKQTTGVFVFDSCADAVEPKKPGKDTQRARLDHLRLLESQNTASDDLFASQVLSCDYIGSYLDQGNGEVNAAVTPHTGGWGRRPHCSVTPLGELFTASSRGQQTPHISGISPGNPLNSVHKEAGVRYAQARKKGGKSRLPRHRLSTDYSPRSAATPRRKDRFVNELSQHIEKLTTQGDDASDISDEYFF